MRKVQTLLDEKKALDKRLEEALRGGGDQVRGWLATAPLVGGLKVVAQAVQVEDARTLQAMGDALREQMGSGVAALGATMADGKATLLVVATDDARDRGARADTIIKELAAAAGGRGGGKPHMAQAGIPDPARLGQGLALLEQVVRTLVGA